jgi:hypothetical protein
MRPRRPRWSSHSRSAGTLRALSRILAGTLAAAALMPCADALAAGGGVTLNATPPPITPFTPTTPSVSTPTTPTVAAPTTTSSGSGGLSGGAAVAIGIGALVVLGGISFFIWRDARRRAPVRHRVALGPGEGGRAGTRPKPKPRKLSPAERRRRKRGRAR